jgi:hypothetical protein
VRWKKCSNSHSCIQKMASTDVETQQNGSHDSKTVVVELVQLSKLIKDRSAELRDMRKKYKDLGTKVRGIMQSQDITTIQAGGSNVTLYEKKLSQTLTQDFVADSLTEFFKSSADVQMQQPQKVANDAATYIFDSKKSSDRGTQWSLTVRQPKKKEGGAKKAPKKRKATEEEQKEDVPPKKHKSERMEF